jgi:hypothetical protein
VIKMAAAFVAAALWPLANAEDAWDEGDDAHLVGELLADEQREQQVQGIDLSNHTWQETVSVLSRPYHPSLRIHLQTWTHRGPFSSRRRPTIT